MSAFLADTRQTVAPARGAKDGLLPPLLVALTVVFCAAARKLAVADLTTTVLTLTITGLAVLHVHIVYPLVIALVILAAVAIIAVTWARNPRTPRYSAP